MKTLTVYAYVLAFILSFAPGFTGRNNANALREVQEYKQLNTISCGQGDSNNIMFGNVFLRLTFFGWEYDFSTLETGYNTKHTRVRSK